MTARRGSATIVRQLVTRVFSVILCCNSIGYFGTRMIYCSHTQKQTDPWWYVDLGCERTVAKVTVTNGGDCCGKRLNEFKIAVGNDVAFGGTRNAPCGSGYKVSVCRRVDNKLTGNRHEQLIN